MKKFILTLIVMLAASVTVSQAQDDMYFVPKKETKEEKAQRIAEEKARKAQEQAQREAQEKVAFEATQRAYEDMMVRLYRRLYHEDVDIYNRHFTYENPDTLVFDSLGKGDDRIMFSNVNDTLYNVDDNYKYLKMISRFDNIMLDIDEYNGVPAWFYPWYSSPTRLNWDWAYRSARYYNPFYPGWHGGFYDPWFYGYYGGDPWWYSWYDPWYDRYLGWGGYYGWGWGGYYGYRPYYENYYIPNYGYVGHHGSGGGYSRGNTSVSKWGVRTTKNINSGRYASTGSGRSSYTGSSSSYSGSSYSSSSYNPSNRTTTTTTYNPSNRTTTTTTFTPSSSYSSGSSRSYSSGSSSGSYSGGSSRSYSSGSSAGSSGSRGAGGRR